MDMALERFMEQYVRRVAPISEDDRRTIRRIPFNEMSDKEINGYIGFITDVPPGALLGNHFHGHKKELVYVVEGYLELTLEDTRTGQKATETVSEGNLLEFPPFLAHRFRAITASTLAEICFQDLIAVKDDIVPYKFD